MRKTRNWKRAKRKNGKKKNGKHPRLSALFLFSLCNDYVPDCVLFFVGFYV